MCAEVMYCEIHCERGIAEQQAQIDEDFRRNENAEY